MTAKTSANFSPLVSRNVARAAVGDALRLFVGRGRRYSVKQLSNGTGVPDRCIEAAMSDPDSTEWRHLPPEYMLSLYAFLGAPFASEVLRVSGLGAFELPDDVKQCHDLMADDAQDHAEIVRRIADGDVSEDDARALRSVGQREIRRGMKLIAISGGRSANA